jgi:hypothetical protein
MTDFYPGRPVVSSSRETLLLIRRVTSGTNNKTIEFNFLGEIDDGGGLAIERPGALFCGRALYVRRKPIDNNHRAYG